MRTFLTILGIAGGLTLLVLIGAGIAVWTIDVNDFVGPIQKRVKDATGRDLAIGGGIDLKLGLEPKLVLNDVRVGNAPWAKEPQMLTAKRVEAQVALLPLLQRRFELVRLTLIEPVIALETDARGRGNWEFASSGTGVATTATGGASTFDSFGVGNLEVTNGELTYRDAGSGNVTKVVIERFAAHARDAKSPVVAEFRGKVDDVPVAVQGNFGPLETLAQRRTPYPMSVQGEVSGQTTSVTTKLRRVDGLVGFDDLDLSVGSSKATGQVEVTTGGTRPKLALKLAMPSLSLASLPLPRSGATAILPLARDAMKRPRQMFTDDPMSFAALRSYDADGDVAIGELELPNGRRVGKIALRFTLKDGKLDVPALQASAFGGTVQAALTVDATREADPAIALRVDAKALDLAAVLAAAGVVAREVRGGKTDIAIDVTMHGVSQRQWMSGVNGRATAVVGPATIVNSKLDEESPLGRLADAVNPFRNAGPVTELQCAVIRLPLRDGVARVERSVAFETKQLGAAASGTVDFRDETFDLAISPRVRQGIPIDLLQIADLVRLRGPFASPSVVVDSKASVAAVARIGAAVGTGGVSLVGESLLSRPAGGAANSCDVALGRTTATEVAGAGKQRATGAPTVPVTDDVTKALGRLLGR